MENVDLGDLIPWLPEELGLECVTRLPYTSHRVASGVCRRWRELLRSREFYNHRKVNGHSHKVACLVQALPEDGDASSAMNKKKKGSHPARYGIVMFDPVTRIWDRLAPVPKYPEGLPLFCQLGGCEGKLVVMGGWDPVSYEPVRDVFVYDFVTRSWKEGKEMPEKRSFFAIGSGSGKVYVSGGHDENKNALGSGWVYDVRSDEWSKMTPMTRERDECEGFVVAGGEGSGEEEFWVVSGYGTEDQGRFGGDAEVYEYGTGRWRRVEGAWSTGRCPRGSAGVVGGKVVCWGDMVGPEVRVGSCGVVVGERVLVSGSEYQGGKHWFFLEENGKSEKVDVPEEFSGIVQSGCCVEI